MVSVTVELLWCHKTGVPVSYTWLPSSAEMSHHNGLPGCTHLVLCCELQGALFAARGVAQGCGPLLFSAMFNFFTKEAHYFPGAPILGLAIIMVLGAAVGCSVKIPPVPPTNTALQHTVEAQDEELSQFQQDQRVALLHSDVEFKHHSDTPPSLEVGHN